jgi:hypothetical protein
MYQTKVQMQARASGWGLEILRNGNSTRS